MKKLIRFTSSIFLVLILSTFSGGCSGQNVSDVLTERTDFAMDTFVSQKVYGNKKVMDEAFDRVKYLESKFSMYIEGSDVYNINKNSGIKSVKISKETLEAIKKSLYFSQISEGAYDLTIGPVVSLWGITSGNTAVPSHDSINKVLSLVDYKKIKIDMDSIMLEMKGQSIDLGSLGKGIACDEIVRIYKENNVSGIISVGGNIGAVGLKKDGSPWLVGIRDPRGSDNELIGTVKLSDMCAATSGDYERYFEKDGVRYHHIFDTKTGYPADSGLISVTIIAKSGADCDALSTVCFVLGIDRSIELLGKIDAQAVFVDNEKNVYITDGLKDIFDFRGSEKGYKLKYLDK